MKGRTLAAFVKLLVFTAVTVVVTSLLAFTIANTQFRATHSYSAIFTDAALLTPGSEVRIAGVEEGQVSHVELYGRHDAKVTFSVASDVPLTRGTRAYIRYLNLIGQRYVDLVPVAGSDAPLAPGATIPVSQTAPALDLTALFNGFRPLYQALSPKQINQLSYEIIQTLQGTGGTIDDLVLHTASLTSTLADQSQVIDAVIANLTSTLKTVDANTGGLAQLIDELQALMTGLANNRTAIASSLGSINRLAADSSLFIQQIRPALPVDLTQLSSAAHYLATTNNSAGQNFLNEFLGRFPGKLNTIIRTATYGSWFNFYLCDLDGTFTSAGVKVTTSTFHNNVPACNAVYHTSGK